MHEKFNLEVDNSNIKRHFLKPSDRPQRKLVDDEKEQVENLDAWPIKKGTYYCSQQSPMYRQKIWEKAEELVQKNAADIIKTQCRNRALARHRTIVFDTLKNNLYQPRKKPKKITLEKKMQIFNQAGINVRIGEGAIDELPSSKNLPHLDPDYINKRTTKSIVANVTNKNMDIEESRSYKLKYMHEKLEKKKKEEIKLAGERGNLLVRIAQIKDHISELKIADKKYVTMSSMSPEKFIRQKTHLNVNQGNDMGLSQLRAKGQHSIKVDEEQINQLRKDFAEQSEKLEKLRNKIAGIKCEAAKLREEQYDHYHVLLQKGLDTRHDGLSWIIKAIWNLGKNVNLSKLPAYLDDKAVEFLFSVNILLQNFFSFRKKTCNSRK